MRVQPEVVADERPAELAEDVRESTSPRHAREVRAGSGSIFELPHDGRKVERGRTKSRTLPASTIIEFDDSGSDADRRMWAVASLPSSIQGRLAYWSELSERSWASQHGRSQYIYKAEHSSDSEDGDREETASPMSPPRSPRRFRCRSPPAPHPPTPPPLSRPTHEKAGALVSLSVYHLSKVSLVGLCNRATSSLGFGGAFHVAVEVFDFEWSYGWTLGGTGIGHCRPRKDSSHVFWMSVPLGLTQCSRLQFGCVMRLLAPHWLGSDYNMIHINCTHFAEALMEILDVGPLPKWVATLSKNVEVIAAPIKRFRKSSLQSFPLLPQSDSVEVAPLIRSRRSRNSSQTCVAQ